MVLSKLSYHTPPGKVIVKRAPGPSTLHIRWQAIRMYYENERWQDIERTTGFSERTMRRWLAEGAARQTVMVTLPNSGKHALSQRAQRELVEILEHDPQLYYDELRFLVYARTNEVASLSTIRRVAIKNGFRIKVAQPVSSYRNARTMQLHAELRAQYHWTQFIYVDEAHKAGKNLARKRGKVRKGRTCFVPLTSHLSRSWTMVAAMNHQGLVGHHIQELGRGDGPLPHAITRELWLEMFKAKILPHLGNADLGEENSVVIIDNASVHWGSDDDCSQRAGRAGPQPRRGAPVHAAVLPPRQRHRGDVQGHERLHPPRAALGRGGPGRGHSPWAAQRRRARARVRDAV